MLNSFEQQGVLKNDCNSVNFFPTINTSEVSLFLKIFSMHNTDLSCNVTQLFLIDKVNSYFLVQTVL